MKRVGILGGTYNPPHIGHLLVASEVKYALELDEVRLMPTAMPPHKAADEAVTKEQRLEMVELAVEGCLGLTASSFEVDRGGVSYTFDTMTSLVKAEPNTKFYFIMGGDMIEQLDTWYRIDELAELVTLIGVNRPGWQNRTNYPVQFVEIPEIDLSSTLLRHRFQQGGSVAFLLPTKVEAFIRGEGLYGTH